MKYAPTYFHHHIVMRDFNGAITFQEPDSNALFAMHRAIRNRDELGMAIAYAEFAGALPFSAPELRAVLNELVEYIRGIGSDAEYESFIYDLDSQGPVGAPMWRMSLRALNIVRDLARNRTHRIAENTAEREHVLRVAQKTMARSFGSARNSVDAECAALRKEGVMMSHEELVAYSRWADEMCREALHNGVLFPMQGEAIISSRGDKFSHLQREEKNEVLKQFVVQHRDNSRIARNYNSAVEASRCDVLCSIFDHVYREPLAAPIVDSIRDDYRPDNLYQLPLHVLSQIKQRLETKESYMDIAADAPDTASEAEAYTLDKFAADAKAAYDNAAEKGRIARIDLASDLDGFKKRANQAGLSPSLVQVILYTIGTDTIVKSLSGE